MTGVALEWGQSYAQGLDRGGGLWQPEAGSTLGLFSDCVSFLKVL